MLQGIKAFQRLGWIKLGRNVDDRYIRDARDLFFGIVNHLQDAASTGKIGADIVEHFNNQGRKKGILRQKLAYLLEILDCVYVLDLLELQGVKEHR